MHLCVLTTSFPKDNNDYAGIFVLHYLNSLPPEIDKITVLTPHKAGALAQDNWGRICVRRFKYFFPSSQEKLLLDGGIMVNVKKHYLALIQIPIFFIAGFFHAFKHARQADFIHANWIFYGLIGSLVSKIYKKRLVITLHGSDVELIKTSAFFKKIGSWALNRADSIICVSQFLKNEISPYLNDVDKVKVFANGVGNMEGFLKNKPSAKTDLRPTMLWVGRLSPEKNVPLLLKITRLVKNKMPLVNVDVVGSGPLMEQMKKSSRDLGLENNVFFAGQVSHGQISEYFAKAGVFIITSQREGFGIVIAEAMASGLPVVASRTGSIPEIVDEGITGFLCDKNSEQAFADKIIKLFINPGLRLEMGLSGRKKALARYNWDNIAKQIYREIYLKFYG